MARELTFKDAINEALAQEMARDETVIAMERTMLVEWVQMGRSMPGVEYLG